MLLSGCHSGNTMSLACLPGRSLPRAEPGDNARRWAWAEDEEDEEDVVEVEVETEAEGIDTTEGRRRGSGGSGDCELWVRRESMSRALIAAVMVLSEVSVGG